MATRHTPSQNLKSTGPTLCGLALFIVFPDLLDETALQLSRDLCTFAGELFKLLPAIVLVACQALEANALDHERLFACSQVFVSLWPLLQFVVGVA